MAHRMGRLTKRNRAKHRSRAYAAAMLRSDERIRDAATISARRDRGRLGVDDKRAA